MRHSSVLAVLIAAIALLPLTASATTSRSDARTAWDRISGPTQPGVELGLARTKDGVLHAISNRGVSGTSISETRIAPSGKTIGTSTVATGWDGNGGLGIAARMFVSAKTVEANLSRVYRKLGVSARTQLGRALAEAQPPRS
jgi:hypothetical protein